tara:strand:+ start:177 stop:1406 length:1230 start_codon:yes stop_codon:yes gene_type:complete
MASVYKRKGSPYYQVAYFTSAGERKYRSTGQKTKNAALEVAVQWEKEENRARAEKRRLQPEIADVITKAARLANEGRLTIDRTRNFLLQLYELSSGESFPDYSIEGWLEHWLETQRQLVKTKSIQRYQNSISDVIKALGSKATKSIELLTTEDVEDVQTNLSKSRKSEEGTKKKAAKASTLNYKLQDFKSAITAAYEQGLLDRDVGKPVRYLKKNDSEVVGAFKMTEVEQLIRHSKPDWKGAILIAAHTGLRLTNVTKLLWQDVDLEKQELNVTPVKQRGGQRKVVSIPMTTSVLEFLKNRWQENAKAKYVFPTLAERTAATHSTTFNNLMEKASVPKRVKLSGGAEAKRSFHSLRHTFISSLAKADVTEEIRKELAAHKSAEVHKLYTHHDKSALRDAIGTIPEISIS